MRILALDTSTEFLSLALMLDGKNYTRDIHAGQTHSQQILPVLRELLDEAGVTLQSLDGIAFGEGPGSFTGLRIGCGVAQGLAFGANLPVVGVSTLLALAHGAYVETNAQKVIASLDARMGEIYHAAYERIYEESGEEADEGSGETWREICPPSLCKAENSPTINGQDWVGVGSAWGVYAQQLNNYYAQQVTNSLPNINPKALTIAQLAAPIFQAGLGRPAHQAAPVYIRNKIALKMSER